MILRGIEANVFDSDTVVNEFEPLSYYYAHFETTNILKTISTTVFLERCLSH